MGKLLTMVKSKTVWGSLVLAASFIPVLTPYAAILHAIGTGLAGVGVADKLDKIHNAALAPDASKPQPDASQPAAK